MTNTTDQEATMTATTTPVRFAAERVDGDWTVIRTDSTGRQGVGTYPSREQARAAARERNEQAAGHAVPDPLTGAALPTEAPTPEEAAAEQAALDVPIGQPPADPAPAPVVKAAKHQRTSLAKVKVGDQLMTNLVTEGNGIVYVTAHRTSDGQVRKVAEVTKRKAEGSEMPGTLYTLVFEDGTCSEERYGTTSHYLADVFDGQPATPAPAPAPTPAPKASPAKKTAAMKTAPVPKIATTGSRAGKLVKGDRLVTRDLGVVTVDGVSKVGGGKVVVAFTGHDGEACEREMWSSTNVRVAD